MKFMNVKAVDGIIRMPKVVCGAGSVLFNDTMDPKGAFTILDRYIQLGGTAVDTAKMYGKLEDSDPPRSEILIGKWIKERKNRKEIVLITKGCAPVVGKGIARVSVENIHKDFTESLQALDVDYVDVYFMHRDDPQLPVSVIMDALDEHVKAGQIRALGASNWTVARINEANAYAVSQGKTPFTVSQIQWSMAYVTPEIWPDPTLVCMNETEYKGYLENKIPVMAFSSQAGGYFAKMVAGGEQLLSPKIKRRYDCEINRKRLEKLRTFCEKNNVSPAALCVAYITNNRLEGAAIIGSSKVAQMEESIQGVDVDLDFDTCDSFIK